MTTTAAPRAAPPRRSARPRWTASCDQRLLELLALVVLVRRATRRRRAARR